MNNLFIIPCGGQIALPRSPDDAVVLPLNAWASQRNRPDYVRLNMEDLHGKLFKPVPKQFEDLLDIATYVYCADQATSRGGMDVDNFGGRWRRRFQFHVPVREPDFWNTPTVKQALCDTLGFLSEDIFEFNFIAAKNAPGMQHYFSGLKTDGFSGEPQQVAMFSGGLDSLAGAVEEAVQFKHRLMLVNHRPTDKLNNFHRRLEALLAQKAGNFAPTHLHVHINKKRELNKNYTQRTRSFLYVALGATVARMLGQQSVRFYENGVVSMNLPVCAQVLGSRATRTTHPRVLRDYSNLLELVAGTPFKVENPFIWDTKGEIVGKIIKAECSELIANSISCAHTFSFSNEHPHCGTCSQCIDRRFGILAAGAAAHDPASGYATDIFTGSRPLEEDRMMMALYLERAKRVANIKSAAEIVTVFPEVVRTLKYLGDSPLAMAEQVVALHKRHGLEVKRVLEDMLRHYTAKIVDRSLPKDSLLRIVYDSGPAEARPEPPRKFHKEQEKRLEDAKESPATYRLRRGNGFWELVFKGEREVIKEERGIELIDSLFKDPPPEPIHAVALEARLNGEPLDEHTAANRDGGVVEVDDESFTMEASGRALMGGNVSELLRKKFSELQRDIDDETLPAHEREKARDERETLLAGVRNGPKIVDQASRAAERVRKAMKGVMDTFKKAERRRGVPNETLRAFAKHLEDYLWIPSMGGRNRVGAAGKAGCYIYIRPTGVIWRD